MRKNIKDCHFPLNSHNMYSRYITMVTGNGDIWIFKISFLEMKWC